MPQVLHWPPNDPRAVVYSCRRAIAGGGLVVLPTESGYGLAASGLNTDAVGRLAAAVRGDHTADAPPLPAIAVRGPDEARDWVPEPGVIGGRLVRRCWPGPVVLAFANGLKSGAATRLPLGVLRTIGPGWELGLLAPNHPAIQAILDTVSVPLVLGEVILDGDPAETCGTALTAIGHSVKLAVDAGPSLLKRPATVVEICGERWTVRRPGAVSDTELARLAARTVIFVCTGNTCRSPLAEALCKRLLGDRIGCAIEDLPNRGFVIESAGLAALRGEPAAAEAVAVAAELGADLSRHSSRSATPDLLDQADDVVGMTAGHLHGLGVFPHRGGRSRLLCGDVDLADPIGGDRAVYQACAGTIWQHLQRLVDELLEQ